MRRYLVPSIVMIAALALVTGPTVASAAVPVTQKGKIGKFVITDTNDQPGVACTYDADVPGNQGNDIDIMTATGPWVTARNRSPRRDHQIVGVKYFFQRSRNEGGSGGWVTAKGTRMARKTAYDNKAAIFPQRRWVVPIDANYHFRVLATIYWFRPGSRSRVEGFARQRYVYYQTFLAGPFSVEMDRCLPEP